jgi:hypothetical protein
MKKQFLRGASVLPIRHFAVSTLVFLLLSQLACSKKTGSGGSPPPVTPPVIPPVTFHDSRFHFT